MRLKILNDQSYNNTEVMNESWLIPKELANQSTSMGNIGKLITRDNLLIKTAVLGVLGNNSVYVDTITTIIDTFLQSYPVIGTLLKVILRNPGSSYILIKLIEHIIVYKAAVHNVEKEKGGPIAQKVEGSFMRNIIKGKSLEEKEYERDKINLNQQMNNYYQNASGHTTGVGDRLKYLGKSIFSRPSVKNLDSNEENVNTTVS